MAPVFVRAPLVPRSARVRAADAADGAEPTLHCGCVALGAEAIAVGDEVDDGPPMSNRLPRCAEEVVGAAPLPRIAYE